MSAEPDFRLPRNALPSRYEIELRPELAAARFDGRCAVTLEVVEATDRLVLNAADLDITAASLKAPAGTAPVPAVSYDEADQRVTLTFPGQLEPGPGYELTLEFSGTLNDKLRGFYRSTFRDDAGHEGVIATTQFEAADARRAFPCWDEPDFKATFQITLLVEPGLSCVSNGPLESRRELPDGRVEMRFAETMVMSTYLVAFVVGPYELTDPVLVDGVPIRVAAVPGKLQLAPFALEVAAHALRFLGGYFGIPYAGTKIDHVAVPDFAAGAMENLGCITYRESVLLIEPDNAAQTELQRIAAVVSHETAHMWFGDLVTMRWWNGLWLNEAFATFMELTTTEAFRPEWQVWTTFGAGKSAAMVVDGLQATRPVEFKVGRPEDADAMFDVLTYQKGGSVLRMLEQYLDPEVFRKGIAHYLATHAYGNTETGDLWSAIEDVSGEPVRAIMASWIDQGGYPMVNAEMGGDPSTIVLSQDRFVYGGTGGSALWAVPVNLRASVDGKVQRARLLLDQKSCTHTFGGKVDWVVVNDGAWGFYRTRYSQSLRQRLEHAGPLSVLVPLERLALLGDTWAAVTAGQAELAEWASMAEAVAPDPDPDVWASIVGVLAALKLAGDDGDREALKEFALRLARPVWDGLTWSASPGEPQRHAVARARVLLAVAQIGGDRQVVAEAQERFERYRPDEGGAAVLSPDLVGAAARISVAHGAEGAWEAVLERYRSATNPQEKLRYLYALSEARSPQLRMRTLEIALGPEVRSQDAPFVMSQVLAQRGAARPAWDWVERHWDEIENGMPSSLWLRVLDGATTFTDSGLAADFHRFCAGRELPVGAIRIEQILERMDVNVALAGRIRGSIAAALQGTW